MASPPPGIQVAIADEANYHQWDVLIAGPADSPYAVRTPDSSVSSSLTSTGRAVQAAPSTPHRIPLQAAQDQLQNAHLPPQRHQRRARRAVPRHAQGRPVEAV